MEKCPARTGETWLIEIGNESLHEQTIEGFAKDGEYIKVGYNISYNGNPVWHTEWIKTSHLKFVQKLSGDSKLG